MKCIDSCLRDDTSHRNSAAAREECAMQRRFAALGLAPKVHACRGGCIYMDMIDGTIEDYLKKRRSKADLSMLVHWIFRFIRIMCEHRLAHGDLHWENLGFRYTRTGRVKPLMIDFGQAASRVHEGPMQGRRGVTCREPGASPWGFAELEVLSLLRTLHRDYSGRMNEDNRRTLREMLVQEYNALPAGVNKPLSGGATRRFQDEVESRHSKLWRRYRKKYLI